MCIANLLERCGLVLNSDASVDSVELVTPPRLSISIKDVAMGFRASVHPIAVKRLKCSFRCSGPMLRDDTREIAVFLAAVSRVEEIIFDCTPMAILRNFLPFTEIPNEVQAFHRASIAALHLAASRGCTSFVVRGPPYCIDDVGLSQRYKALAASYTSPLTKMKSAIGIHTPNLLSDHDIFPDPCSLLVRWIQAMRPNRLSKLSLDDITIRNDEWSEALSSLKFPRLTYLSITSCHISLQIVVSFLIRHPSVKTLHLGDASTGSALEEGRVAGSTFLPLRRSRLVSLHAPAVTVRDLLLRWPNLFRQLSQIHLIADIGQASEIDPIMGLLTPVLTGKAAKVVSLSLSPRSRDWLGTYVYTPDPTIRTTIAHIEIAARWLSLGPTRDRFPEWISQFTSLTSIDILGPSLWSRCSKQKTRLAAAIHNRCKLVRTINIGGVEADKDGAGSCFCPECVGP
ncbi:hypothetical protein HGRIS_013694 [Hohenbuehelia grisea]|uniref:F-box domain-containing protein n=1 Tax=Hohenbuehelia grisea TaxID=104357 RepID=A0ABR3IWC4_9AGAR